MTLRNLLPAIALLLGVILGALGTKALSPPKKSFFAQPEGVPTKSTTGKSGSSESSAPPTLSLDDNFTLPGGPFTGSAEELLKLGGPAYAEINFAEFALTVESLSESQVAALLQEIETSHSQDKRSWKTRSALIRRWAKLNPDRALAASLEYKDSRVRSILLYAVASVIATQDPERAIALAENTESKAEQIRLFGAIAANIAEQDPARALDLLFRTGEKTQYYYHGVFDSWMGSDPTAAIEAVKTIKYQHGRWQAEDAIVDFLTRHDPEKAWAYALTESGNSQRIIGQVALRMAAEDPQLAISLIDQLPKGKRKAHAMNEFFEGWMKQDSDAARNWILTLPDDEKAKALQSSLTSLAKTNPEETVSLLEYVKPNARTAKLYSSLAYNWAQSDPDAALKWVKELPPGPTRQEAQSSLLRTLAQNNPDKAMEFLKGEKITNQNLYEVSPIAASMASEDPEAAFAWLESLDVEGEARKNLIANTISQVASNDGSKAASYVLTIEDKSIRKDAISKLLSSWGQQDLESAKTWIDSNLEVGEKLTAYSGLLKGLSNQNPQTATELLVEASQGLTAEEVEKHFGNSMKQIARGLGTY